MDYNIVYNIPSTPNIIKARAPRLTFLSGNFQVSDPTVCVLILMFLTSAAIFVLSAVEVVSIILDSSKSSLSDRVDRFEEPMNVANGFGGEEGDVDEDDSHIPIECQCTSRSVAGLDFAARRSDLWRDTSSRPSSTRLFRFHQHFRPIPCPFAQHLREIGSPAMCNLPVSAWIHLPIHKIRWPEIEDD
jgi:hypothetical protein